MFSQGSDTKFNHAFFISSTITPMPSFSNSPYVVTNWPIDQYTNSDISSLSSHTVSLTSPINFILQTQTQHSDGTQMTKYDQLKEHILIFFIDFIRLLFILHCSCIPDDSFCLSLVLNLKILIIFITLNVSCMMCTVVRVCGCLVCLVSFIFGMRLFWVRGVCYGAHRVVFVSCVCIIG